MGSWVSTPSSGASGTITDSLIPPRSPAHPSRSDLNPAPRSGFSYFLPVTRPELQHSHLQPTLDDVTEVMHILSGLMPPELVCRVMEEARYWAGQRNLLQKELDVKAGLASPRTGPAGLGRWSNGQEELEYAKRGAGLRDGDGEVWYLLSEEIGSGGPRSAGFTTSDIPNQVSRKRAMTTKSSEKLDISEEDAVQEEGEDREQGCWAREIVIETLSKDQGWSTAVTHNPALYGSYDQSFSWFEISLLREGREIQGTRRSILNNVHAGQYFKAHRVILGPEDKLVKVAKKGDRVVLWARAQYPGWRNIVREAAITVYCAPFPQQI